MNFADEYYGASMLGNDYPLQTSCEGGAMWYKERGRYVTVNGGLRGEEGQFYLSDGVSVSDRPYIPKKGDLIYIEWYKYNRLDHVGIVEMVTQDSDGTYYVHTIEGNNHILGPTPSVVQRYTYRLDDDSIRGYGVLTEGLVGWELGMGASGSQVIALQKNLKELGYYDGDCAGKLGKASVEAIKKFQAHGLDVTGTADWETQKSMNEQLSDLRADAAAQAEAAAQAKVQENLEAAKAHPVFVVRRVRPGGRGGGMGTPDRGNRRAGHGSKGKKCIFPTRPTASARRMTRGADFLRRVGRRPVVERAGWTKVPRPTTTATSWSRAG